MLTLDSLEAFLSGGLLRVIRLSTRSSRRELKSGVISRSEITIKLVSR